MIGYVTRWLNENCRVALLFRLHEREAVFIINLDYLFYVDHSGEIFKVLRAGDPLNYPLVSGMDRQQLLDEPDKSREQLQLVAGLIEELPTA